MQVLPRLLPFYPNRTDSNEAFEVASDIQLPLYTAQNNPGIYNVDFSYNNAGNWYNYTRNPWPAGNYEVYARISGGQGAGSELLNLVTSGYGTRQSNHDQSWPVLPGERHGLDPLLLGAADGRPTAIWWR